MGDREETYRTYGDYRRAKEGGGGGGGGGMKRERKAPPRYLDIDEAEPTHKRFRGDGDMPPPGKFKEEDDDDGFQPSMMSFKAFLETQDDSITDDEALAKYGEYKQEFRRQHLNEFFVCHKEEEWFRLKYHPEERLKRRQVVVENLRRRVDIFKQLVMESTIPEDELKLTVEYETSLVRLLDSVVVCLEGGEHEDLAHVAQATPETDWRCLHKTASIHLRNVPAAVTRAELEALGLKYPGFLRAAISEPAPDRRWQRRAWFSFRRDAKVKEICYSLANTKLRDTDLSPVLNKDLSQRIRPVSLLANDRRCMRRDIRLSAGLISRLDAKWALWEMRQTSELLGAESTNPVLQNITEYLVEEASAEEEELLGGKQDEEDRMVSVSVDESLGRVLDRMLLYLRIVHSVDYYNLSEYSNEDDMPNRCGILHVRDRLVDGQQSLVSEREIEDYCELFEKRARGSLLSTSPETLSDQEAAKLGLKVEQDELEKFIQANTQELGKEKWLCPLSNKKFKGAEFVRKHIFNKHGEKVAAVKADVEYFNNFLRDPRRPQLPEKPKPKPKPGAARPAEPGEIEWRKEETRAPLPPPAHRKGSIKDRLGFRPSALQVTHSASDPRGMVDYSDVDFPGFDDLF